MYEKSKSTNREILEFATLEFASLSYRGFTINKFLKKYEISKGKFYHHFDGKKSLYKMVLQNVYKSLVYRIKENNFSDLHSYVRSRLLFFKENPSYSAIFYDAQSSNDPEIISVIEESRKVLEDFNRSMFKSLTSNIKLKDGITDEDLDFYFEIMQGMFSSYFRVMPNYGVNGDSFNAFEEKNLEKLLSFLIYGIGEEK